MIIRKLIARVLGWRVAMLTDFDGEVTFRLAQPIKVNGKLRFYKAWRMSRVFRVGVVFYHPDDQRMSGPTSYVKYWEFVA